MNQIAIIDDLAARRSAAARKAVATRRARLLNPTAVNDHRPRDQVSEALALFSNESTSQMPDWHKVALQLRRALSAPPIQSKKLTRPPVVAIAAPVWPDYAVGHLGSFKVRNPTIVVTFADGEIVRAPAVSAKDKPVNIGRGLRVAIAFYQARLCRRAGLRFKPAYIRSVPAITSCTCEDTGEIYDAELCTAKTAEIRHQHERRRIEGTSL